MVAIELNHEARRIGHDLGAARTLSADGLFNADKCRIRWSYIHLLVRIASNRVLEKARQAGPVQSRST